jgi:uncharacterized protein (TIGR03084 family)
MADETTYSALLDDLVAEEADLDTIVAPLDEAAWRTATPAAGWDVRDSIAHLAFSEELASAAAVDQVAFDARLNELIADLGEAEAALVGKGRSVSGPEVLAWWREAREATLDGLRAHDARDRLPWIAGPMSAMSFATARLMETWAHGQDVVDGLGIEREPTVRLRHVADLGVRTRRHAYVNRGLAVPEGDVRVELRAPDGSEWAWGASGADVVRGPALDFCRVVTQRANPADTVLEVTGPLARDWIGIAQAYAGPATDHRRPQPT